MEDTSDLEKTLEYRPAASVRPVSVDPRAPRAPRRGRRTVSSGMIAVALLTALAFVGAAVARLGIAESSPPSRTATFAREVPKGVDSPRAAAPERAGAGEGAAAGAATVGSATTTGEIPTVDVATLPRPPIGTVIGAPKHRLWVDGHLAPSWKRTVKCGEHMVQVGSQGEARTVNVPCGGEISVAP